MKKVNIKTIFIILLLVIIDFISKLLVINLLKNYEQASLRKNKKVIKNINQNKMILCCQTL